MKAKPNLSVSGGTVSLVYSLEHAELNLEHRLEVLAAACGRSANDHLANWLDVALQLYSEDALEVIDCAVGDLFEDEEVFQARLLDRALDALPNDQWIWEEHHESVEHVRDVLVGLNVRADLVDSLIAAARALDGARVRELALLVPDACPEQTS